MTEKKNGMAFGDVEMISRMLDENLVKIRQLNDDLRVRRLGGTIVVTAGIAGLGASAVTKMMPPLPRLTLSRRRTIPMASMTARS